MNMKGIHVILTLLFSCLWAVACQSVEEPVRTEPTVRTEEVREIGREEAKVTGSVNVASICSFLLSTLPDLSDARQVEARLTDAAAGSYEGVLSSLLPNTTYYVALSASDGQTNVVGNVQMFTTLPAVGIGKVFLWDWTAIGAESGRLPYVGGPMGAFLYSLPEGGDACLVEASNLYVSYENGTWTLPVSLDLEEAARYFAVYAPYQESYGEFHQIRVAANTDFLAGVSGPVHSQSPYADIDLHHRMAKVTLEVRTSEASNVDYTLGAVALQNAQQSSAIVRCADFDMCTQKMTPVVDENHDGLSVDCDVRLGSEKAAVIDFYVVPTSFHQGEVVLSLTEKGSLENRLAAPFGDAAWESGLHYVYPVTVTSSGLQIGDVRLEDWENNEGGTIIIK